MIVSSLGSSVSAVFLVLAESVCLLLSLCVRDVCMQTCDPDVGFVNRPYMPRVGADLQSQDVFTNLQRPCEPNQECNSQNTCAENSHDGTWLNGRCRCKCDDGHRTFDFTKCVNLEEFKSSSGSQCSVGLERSTQVPIRKLPDEAAGYIKPMGQSQLLWNGNPNISSVEVISAKYFTHNKQWQLLSQHVGPYHKFIVAKKTMNGREIFRIKYDSPGEPSIKRCFDGLIIKLTLQLLLQNNTMTADCIIFKLAGQLEYNDNGILQCEGFQPPTTHNTDADDTTSSGSSNAPTTIQTTTRTSCHSQQVPDKMSTTAMQSRHHTTPAMLGGKDKMKSSPVGAIVAGVCAAVVIFIVGGVVLFILWRRKFRPSLSKKNKNQRVTMSSLQNGHPHSTEGTVDNVIYAGDDTGIVDNVIYEGGMGADGVFSNPGYADKTPQFKPRMDVPGAFVQPNPGATNKTPQPQRNIIIEEPQYAQIVDDQYADPQKVRDRKDKKNKKKAGKDKNYADLHGPHEKQPGANNSNSNHVYQGLNKGADYQSLRGPREHHEVRPSQVPKTPQDEHDYTSLTHGDSKASAGTLSKEGPDYTVLEGPDSPGEETATGPDYTTLDGPDSPGDEITSGPDYTVLDGPDSPGD